MTSVFASSTFARCEASFTAPMKRLPASRPPLSVKPKTAPGPCGMYFLLLA